MKISLILLLNLMAVSLLMGESSGKVLYNQKCASCHGLNAEKKALNSSKILNTLDEEEITNALMGYKDGTYGGKLRSVKRTIVSTLSENDINTLAVYVQLIRP